MKDDKKETKQSGRPRTHLGGARHVTLYLSLDRAEALKRLGGSQWVSKKIDEEEKCRLLQK